MLDSAERNDILNLNQDLVIENSHQDQAESDKAKKTEIETQAVSKFLTADRKHEANQTSEVGEPYDKDHENTGSDAEGTQFSPKITNLNCYGANMRISEFNQTPEQINEETASQTKNTYTTNKNRSNHSTDLKFLVILPN